MYLMFVYMAGENTFWGPLEGVGPKNRDFFGPEMATSKVCAIWARKQPDFQAPPSPNGPSNGFSHIKIIEPKGQVHW